MAETTSEGLPIAQDPPHGAAMAVCHHARTRLDLLPPPPGAPEREGDVSRGMVGAER